MIFMDVNYIIHSVLIVIMCDHFAIDPFCPSVFSLLCQELPLFPIDCVGVSLTLSLSPLFGHVIIFITSNMMYDCFPLGITLKHEKRNNIR